MSDNIQPVTFKPCGPYKVPMTLVGTAVRLQDDAQDAGATIVELNEEPCYVVLDQRPGKFTGDKKLLHDLRLAEETGSELTTTAWLKDCIDQRKHWSTEGSIVELPRHPDAGKKPKGTITVTVPKP